MPTWGAEEISGEFNLEESTNTLSAFATMGRKPGEQLMGQLEGRAEAISGEFNSQDVANTLWAFATIGRKPGEQLMGQLERRAEAISGEFNLQDVANTLWAFATMGRTLACGCPPACMLSKLILGRRVKQHFLKHLLSRLRASSK
jgi:uncharacterized alpha-E superfamily protein